MYADTPAPVRTNNRNQGLFFTHYESDAKQKVSSS